MIKDGSIVKVGCHIEYTEHCSIEEITIIDAEENYVFPGFIDAHTHPGLPEDLGFLKQTDDFVTETAAAAKGGTTTIMDFAEQKRGQRLIDALEQRKRRYEGKANCKYSFHIAITDLQEDMYDQFVEVKKLGINSVKLYSTYGMMLSNAEILRVMDICSKLDMVVMVHCEENSIVEFCSSHSNYGHTRPSCAEQNMINTIVNFSKITGCKVYICHVSSKEGMEVIIKAKIEGVKVYFETCPQYLLLQSSVYDIQDEEMTKFILSPPLREAADNKALIDAALNGYVDVISTDHCAFNFEEHKSKYFNDLDKAAKGMPGIQMRVSLMYDLLVEKHGMDIKDFVRIMSYNPSVIFNLKGRGQIKEGMCGDLVIWSRENFIVTMDEICEATDYSPYEGLVVTGRPKIVLN